MVVRAGMMAAVDWRIAGYRGKHMNAGRGVVRHMLSRSMRR